MGHDITDNMFLSVRQPAWHNLGQSWTGPKTAVEAVSDCRASEVTIQTRRMGYQCEDGSFTPIDDRRVIVRMPIPSDPREQTLGVAGEGYTVLQNDQIASILDQSGITAKFPVETCGVLAKGGTLFIACAMGEGTIAGEDHTRYVLFSDTRDGKSAFTALTTWTRVVCRNTLNAAMLNGAVKLALTHDAHLESNFRLGLDVIGQLEASSEHVRQSIEALSHIRVRAEQVAGAWDAAYAYAPKGTLVASYERIDNPSTFDPATLTRLQKMKERYDYERANRDRMKEVAASRYDILCQEYPRHAGTALGVFNAVCEVADHTRNSQKSSLSAIYGMRADEKVRVWKYLTETIA